MSDVADGKTARMARARTRLLLAEEKGGRLSSLAAVPGVKMATVI